MAVEGKERSLNANDFLAIEALMHDDDLFERIQALLGFVVTPRIRHYIASHLRVYAAVNCRGPGKSEISAARKKIVEGVEVFLKEIKGFRESSESAERQAWKEFFQVSEISYHRDDTVIRSGDHRLEGHSAIEIKLLELLEFAEIRRSKKPGRPRKSREEIFCALYLAFQAAGGYPSANWIDKENKIDSKFVKFATMIIDACPSLLRENLRPGLASALRTQLRKWRKSPAARGAPGDTYGEAWLQHLTAAPHALVSRPSERTPVVVVHKHTPNTVISFYPPNE